MDFDPEHMAAHGGAGRYSRLDPELLPRPLYIMYSENPSESGKVGVRAGAHVSPYHVARARAVM